MKALLALILVACHSNEAPRPAQTPERPDQSIGGTVVPQAHEFPAGTASEIRRIFEGSALSYPVAVMSKEGVQTQFVNPRPIFIGERRFVVGLPPSSHAALDRMIATLKSGAALGATYEVTYWAVEGDAASQTDVTADLAEIAPVLTKLAGFGKRHFRSLDRVGARSRDGASTKLTGSLLKANARLMAAPDGIELELELQLRTDKPETSPGIETTLHVPLDQPIVIGDAAQGAASAGTSNIVLYVVRARRVD